MRTARTAAGFIGTILRLQLLACLMLVAIPAAAQPDEAAVAEWEELNAKVVAAYRDGDYRGGLEWAQEAYEFAERAFGPSDSNTLTSLNNLAALYESQARYGEAEPLYAQVLQLRREALGERHPDTLVSLDNLARLYGYQGRYGEAEPLYTQTLRLRREVLGERHPDTLGSLSSLAVLYARQGRYGEAESLYTQALRLSREVLGERHPDTLVSLSNLAGLYTRQRRHDEAEPLYARALRLSREVLGERHPSTLANLNNLAGLYESQDRHDEAEPLYAEALRLSREVLGERHPSTLGILNNLALLYTRQGRYGEAEPLHAQVLHLSREVLGERHPSTLAGLNNLAGLYESQGRYGEAEPLYAQAQQLSREVLGAGHPQTLKTQMNHVVALVNLGRMADALTHLRRMEPQTLAWAGAELFSTEQGRVRRQLFRAESTLQDVVLTLAARAGGSTAVGLAGDVMLRWKQLQGAEEAYLARLVRRSRDPRVRELAAEIARLRAGLPGLARAGREDEATVALEQLEAREAALGRLSRDYQTHLQVQRANLAQVQAVIPPGGGLIELRRYRPVNLETREFGEPRWAGLLVVGFDEPVFADLGSVGDSAGFVATLLQDGDAEPARGAAAALYGMLFGPFEERIKDLDTIYLAPDGLLNLVPFERLVLADGRYWGERQALRFLQTGRELLPGADATAGGRGLLALGGIDFDAAGVATQQAAGGDGAADGSGNTAIALAAAEVGAGELRAALDQTRAEIGRFRALPASGEEVAGVARLYQRVRRDEPDPAVWMGPVATEGRLKRLDGLAGPPRVLHLATHGFYLSETGAIDQPLLLSGLSLAGANRAFGGGGAGDGEEDGILYSLEAQGLNLDGTELAVLSACETGQGSVDYSEGVYGLARALRTAGAGRVLMTLWPVVDGEARDFMVAFYREWLAQPVSDPAAALRAVKLEYIKRGVDARTWAPYVLVGG